MHESVPIMAEEDRELNSNVDLVSFDKIASKLIKEGFLLTALELHAELIENGKELPRLRDFFSNPSNFEKNLDADSNISGGDTFQSVLHRTSSEQTFDSLDFARNSDDGDRQIDEKIAVLEFELRKARETIKSLRASLTLSSARSDDVSDSAHNTVNTVLESSAADVDFVSDDNLIAKPYEKRALNFLVNEYLMKHNYKLTSITFCDENEDQDFESWDDVGLNIPKPPDLIKLYRRNGYRIGSNFSSAELIASDVQEIL